MSDERLETGVKDLCLFFCLPLWRRAQRWRSGAGSPVDYTHRKFTFNTAFVKYASKLHDKAESRNSSLKLEHLVKQNIFPDMLLRIFDLKAGITRRNIAFSIFHQVMILKKDLVELFFPLFSLGLF